MHPVSLARAFRRAHGCSITWYRRRSRVRRAADLLTTAMPLADVAMESGFTDQSHFCRVFKVETGLTPSVYRRLAV
jgi:AraC family transcriptional regulator